MSGRLIRIEESSGGFMPVCSCGWRALPRVKRENAQRVADQHREAAHPRQATFVASKRRSRALTA